MSNTPAPLRPERGGGTLRNGEALTIHPRLLVLAAVVFGLFLGWAVGYVPANMDNFNQMHRLGCSYPNAYHNTFVEPCDAYLIDFGVFAYHRSYHYVGALSSLMYYPLWALWRSPASYYLLGLLFLVAFSLSLVRAFGLERRYAVIPLCYFPIAFSALHDTGPVKLALLSFPLAALLVKYLLDESSTARKMLFAIACAVLIVACVEDKPFYLFLVPSLGLFLVATLVYSRPPSILVHDLLKNRLPLLLLVGVGSAGLGMLLFVGTTEGQTYLEFLRSAPFTKIRGRRVLVKNFLEYTISFPSYGHRVFWRTEVRLVDIAVALSAAGLFSWALLVAWRDRILARASLLLLGSAYIAMAAVFLVMRSPWAGHHHVFLHVPLLALLLLVAKSTPRRFTFVLGSVIFLNVASMAILTSTPTFDNSARERTALFRYLSQHEVARENIINFSTWGGFYQQALYGDDSQIVTFSYVHWSEEDVPRLKELSGRTSRTILNACLECDLASMKTIFGTSNVREVQLGLEKWRLFQIAP